MASDDERCAWYALLVCIVRGCTVNAALAAMQGDVSRLFCNTLTPEERVARQRARKREQKRRQYARNSEHILAMQRATKERRTKEVGG